VKAALILINLDTEEHFTYVFRNCASGNPLQDAHDMLAAIQDNFTDFIPVFAADALAKKRYHERSVRNAVALSQQAAHAFPGIPHA